jgi:hypothetical protein
MMYNAVELLKMQFSRAVDQTFEHFLDSWSTSAGEVVGSQAPYPGSNELPAADIPVSISA